MHSRKAISIKHSITQRRFEKHQPRFLNETFEKFINTIIPFIKNLSKPTAIHLRWSLRHTPTARRL